MTIWQRGGGEGAVGITVMFGPERYAAKSRAIGQSDPWGPYVVTGDLKGAAKSREVGSGVWEITVDGGPHPADAAVFMFVISLGFIMFI
ncbi:MAG: hypothetical protein A3K18_22275 [Lentisphaerae bacterium RIFOXYA12_64_32]|nr:MAG: hypothetical protein A3K18_22275 [Lentisphaerae bacterium RIFOXYA12_64_32]